MWAPWREVKHEEQIATHKGENLIAIIMPDFYNWCLVKILFACNRLEHFSVEISKIVVAEFMIIYQIPLSAGVFMAPAITLAREINPLWVTELITHEVEITIEQSKDAILIVNLEESETTQEDDLF